METILLSLWINFLVGLDCLELLHCIADELLLYKTIHDTLIINPYTAGKIKQSILKSFRFLGFHIVA